MLAFADESGDTGFNFEKGSTQFFVVSLVIFKDQEQAVACDQRIQQAKKELGYADDFEFHFNHNPHAVRESFLRAVAPCDFLYASVVIDKKYLKISGNSFKNGESFYKHVFGLVFEIALPYLNNTKIKIDRSGSKFFVNEISTYLMRTINKSGNLIKSVKMESASANSLLQLADYVSGIVNWKVQNKKNFGIYYKHIFPKEISLKTWPK